MKITSRLFLAALLGLLLASTSYATAWYNHPVCTNNGTLIGWKTTNTQHVAPPYYIPGAALPSLNILAIKNGGTVIGGNQNKRGGSFKVVGPNGVTARGYINVIVHNGIAQPPTYTPTALYRVFGT
jgi:hypothetical protein